MKRGFMLIDFDKSTAIIESRLIPERFKQSLNVAAVSYTHLDVYKRQDKGDTVTVSRRYYRSGESEYMIDGEIVRRRDIH